MPIVIIVAFAVVVAPICAAVLLLQGHDQNVENREPQPSDFGSVLPSREYMEAHEAWERREAKHITYDLPLEEVLANDKAEKLYWLEVSKRNDECDRWNQRADYSSDEYHYCKVCGAAPLGMVHEGLTLCNDCYAKLVAARESGDYELPDGIAEFSPDLWIYQAIIAVDLDMRVIDEEQAERERKLVTVFVKRKLRKQEISQRQKAQERQIEQQRRERISAATNRLR